MSHSSKKTHQEPLFDSLTTRFSYSVNLKKPESKEPDLGSPISPLATTRRVSLNNATSSSSSSSSSGSVSGKRGNGVGQVGKRNEIGEKNHSGELTETSPVRPDTVRSGINTHNSKRGHRRSMSAGVPLIYSGSSFGSAINNGYHGSSGNNGATSSVSNLLPSGNICPSGKILKTGLATKIGNKTDTLSSGSGHYGHGSIVRGGGGGGGGGGKLALSGGGFGSGSSSEELKAAGNEMYRKGNFVEALALYDKAIALSPDNAAYRSNRGAALTALGRIGEAVRECEEAVRLDPGYTRAHQRLASLYLRLGQAENARQHLCFAGQQPNPIELQKVQLLEKCLKRCADSRNIGDWKSVLREIDASLTIGADFAPQLVACKAEAYLKLLQLEDADFTISSVPKVEHYPAQTKFFGMVAEAYVLYVQAQIDMAFGRFENAVSAAEKAGLLDYSNLEIGMILTNVKMVARARSRGNGLFSSGNYAEASLAYGEGIKYDAMNAVLYCNRAVCWSKLGLWEKSIEDCNQALKIQPNYTKALLRRAASYGKLGRWAEAVRDYEVLRRELPGDKEVVESLHEAQIALKRSQGDIRDIKLGNEVEEICSLNKFKAAITSPGVSVVHFKAVSDEHCDDLSPFLNTLCVRYPSIHFFKVDVEESLVVAKAESIRTVPTFKIYKNGEKVKEIIRPSYQYLEESVRSYYL